MKPGRLCAVLWLVLLSAQPADSARSQEKLRESPYFPLRVGHQWTYRMGNQQVTLRVVATEIIEQTLCAKLETRFGDTILAECIAVQDDGIYRFSADGDAITPPLCFFKPDAKTGTSWRNTATIGTRRIEATFTARKAKVTVPAGTFMTRTATSTDFRLGKEKLAVTSWFAEGVGMVKQRLQVGEREVVLELERFEPAK